LGLLLFMVSTRIAKSVFLFFKIGISGVFIQVGLSACFLIGPFLYLYIKSSLSESTKKDKFWWIHILLPLFIIGCISYNYSYTEDRRVWGYFIRYVIYSQWLIYVLISGFLLRNDFRKLFSKKEKVSDSQIWILSVFSGVSFIWFVYYTSSYTSYIVGALSFSFILYLVILFWILWRRKTFVASEKSEKYVNKKIESEEANSILLDLEKVLVEKSLFKNSNLKLADVAKETKVLPHQLSQFLNDNLGKSFAQFINEYRIEEAKKLLLTENRYTIEVIGYECGFNSKSTFFTALKKIIVSIPASYKK
jgi:AraC-like DNA-binding protein